MKRIIIFLIMFNTYYNSQAQVKSVKDAPPLDKFAGTWTYKGENKEFTIVLAKYTQIKQNSNRSYYLIHGNYILKENGKILVNTLNDSIAQISLGGYSFGVDNLVDTNRIYAGFRDIVKMTSGDATLTFEANNNQRLVWRLHEREGIHLGKRDHTFTVPKWVTLIRQ